ncbi:MAG: sugar ABC transporter permease [Clostridia bacterium]|nr:sugar ABC transporter permease [Clostridia bacterium]
MKLSLKLPKKKASLDARRARAGYLFTLPFILGVFLIYLPILLDSIWFSFNQEVAGDTVNGMPTTEIQFVGMQFYKEAFQTSDFTSALLSGLQQLIFEVPAIIIFSLFIAVVLNQKMLGRAVFRAIYFVPVIISTGLMESINATDNMQDMMEGGINDGSGSDSGIISVMDVQELFADMQIGSDIIGYIVKLVNDIYNIINYSGVQMLIFLAGLQSISPAIYEACTIDGATGWETFWKITFPMISPMILVNAAYTIIDSFTRPTNIVMSYIETVKTNASIAMSWIFFLIVVLIILLVAAILSSFIFYQRRD